MESEKRAKIQMAITRRAALGGLAGLGASAMFGDMVPALAAAAGAPAQQVNVAPTMGFVLWQEQFPQPDLLRFGDAAEKAGFSTVWTSDHLQPWQPNDGHAGQAWVTLGALSQRTTRIHFGTGVTCPSFRYRPAIVAEAWATLSLLAPGRVFLGLGTGENLNEGAGGGGWTHYRDRAARLVEAVAIIRKLWTGEHVRFAGKFWTIDARLYDRPTSPIPIYIAAGGPKSARLSGMYGDGLIADPVQLKTNPAYKAAWEAGARAVGKDPARMPILMEHFAVVGGEQDAIYSAQKVRFQGKAWKPGYFNNISPLAIQQRATREIPLRSLYSQWPVSLDPQVHVQAVQKAVDLGVTHLFVHSAQPDQLAVIDFYGRNVLPSVRGGAITGVRQVTGLL